MDFNEIDFEQLFNNSTRSRKIVCYVDTLDLDGETLNKGQLSYTIKASASYQNVIGAASRKIGTNGIARYVIKCEDENGHTASLANNAAANSWGQPAKQFIDLIPLDKNGLYTFLRNR